MCVRADKISVFVWQQMEYCVETETRLGNQILKLFFCDTAQNYFELTIVRGAQALFVVF